MDLNTKVAETGDVIDKCGKGAELSHHSVEKTSAV